MSSNLVCNHTRNETNQTPAMQASNFVNKNVTKTLKKANERHTEEDELTDKRGTFFNTAFLQRWRGKRLAQP